MWAFPLTIILMRRLEMSTTDEENWLDYHTRKILGLKMHLKFQFNL